MIYTDDDVTEIYEHARSLPYIRLHPLIPLFVNYLMPKNMYKLAAWYTRSLMWTRSNDDTEYVPRQKEMVLPLWFEQQWKLNHSIIEDMNFIGYLIYCLRHSPHRVEKSYDEWVSSERGLNDWMSYLSYFTNNHDFTNNFSEPNQIEFISMTPTGNCSDDCSICLESMSSGNIIMTGCRHIFHKDCIDRSLNMTNNKCPLCRATIKL